MMQYANVDTTFMYDGRSCKDSIQSFLYKASILFGANSTLQSSASPDLVRVPGKYIIGLPIVDIITRQQGMRPKAHE